VKMLQNVRKLIDTASDMSLAEVCLSRLNLPLDDPLLVKSPHLSPTMAALWRVYRESPPDVLAGLTCNTPLFNSRVFLPEVLMWAAVSGTDSTAVPGQSQLRSQYLQQHLVLATCHVLSPEPVTAAQGDAQEKGVCGLWSGLFAALLPDIDSCKPLPMLAYAILASSMRRPAPEWPRLLQVGSMVTFHGLLPLMFRVRSVHLTLHLNSAALLAGHVSHLQSSEGL
jgi:hypothetical protein